MTVVIPLLVILLSMVGGAFFSGMETGVISIHRMRLRHFVRRGSRNAKILQGFLENSDRLFGTTLVGTNICVVLISVTAADLAVELIGELGEAVSTVVVSAFVLIFCEYLPKAWFQNRPLRRCGRYAGFLSLMERLFHPLAIVIIGLTRWMIPGPSKLFSSSVPFVTREEVKLLAKEGERNGVLSPRERVMIHRVMELSGKTPRQIMTPRDEMVLVDGTTTVSEFCAKARETGLTRMPVYDKKGDRFTGVINVFYVLRTCSANPGEPVARFARQPMLIQEDMPVDDIFPRLRHFRQPMSLVIDADNEVTGLVTTEDILEEIVGQL